MILRLGDWCFDVDLDVTAVHSAAEAAEHCDCGYCRNFYAAIDSNYPDFRQFFAQFGLNIEAPERLMPLTPTTYLAFYTVKGNIIQQGNSDLDVNGILVTAKQELEKDGIWVDCFSLSVGPFVLPWVLDEPTEEIVSPANLPAFLESMEETVLQYLPETPVS